MNFVKKNLVPLICGVVVLVWDRGVFLADRVVAGAAAVRTPGPVER